MTQLVAALAMMLMLILPVSGCSSAALSPQDPSLPVGRPSRATTERIALDVSRVVPVPSPGQPPSDEVTLPRELLIRIFAHLDEWRAWAEALEHAGSWRAPSK